MAQRCRGVLASAPVRFAAALRMMCRIAQNDGTMRYGLRASKLAALCEYSVATIHRAERYLVEHGFVERVQVGGGRASTRWRSSSTSSPSSHPSRKRYRTRRTHRAIPLLQRRGLRAHHAGRGSSREVMPSTIVTTICDAHGGDGGTLPDGTPRCPQCRHVPGPVTAQ